MCAMARRRAHPRQRRRAERKALRPRRARWPGAVGSQLNRGVDERALAILARRGGRTQGVDRTVVSKVEAGVVILTRRMAERRPP
ncbi:hypothetical protein DRA43_02520 [Micromonospora provocatoris]|nr:hypothetical protein DRA43_02520 [Micromonospora provocatoris]